MVAKTLQMRRFGAPQNFGTGFWDYDLIKLQTDYELESYLPPVEDTFTLDTFKPNPGGQAEFFKRYPVQAHKPQEFFDFKRWTLLLGGIGSGKSTGGSVFSALHGLWYPDKKGLILANTFEQLSGGTLQALCETCRQFSIPLAPYRDNIHEQAAAIANAHRCFIGPERSYVQVMTSSSFFGRSESGRGHQFFWAWLDEVAYADEKVFLVVDGRMRTRKKREGVTDLPRGVLTTSPNGYNWLYEKFANDSRSEDLKEMYRMFHMPTRENEKNLDEGYIKSLAANYTPELFQQEVEGLFTNTRTGRVYKHYQSRKHGLRGEDTLLLEYDPLQPLHLSFDFNRYPCGCLQAQVVGNEVHVFSEFNLGDATVFELMDELIEWIRRSGYSSIHVYGDATGENDTANSKMSSWQIVRSKLREAGIAPIRYHYPDKNPPKEDRINSVNCMFLQDRCFINVDACPSLHRDLEEMSYEKRNNADLSHRSDELGYLIHSLFPYRISPAKFGKRRIVGIAS